MPAITCFIIAFVISFLLIFVRFYVVNGKTGFPFKEYIINVVMRCFFTIGIVALFPISIRYIMGEGPIRLIINCTVCIFTGLLAIYIIGLNKYEKNAVVLYVKKLRKQQC